MVPNRDMGSASKKLTDTHICLNALNGGIE